MNSPSLACWWQADAQVLDLRSRRGAWRVRLWPEPAVLTTIGPAAGGAPPLHLLLADAPVVSAELVDLVVAVRTIPAPIRRCIARCVPPAEQLRGLQLLHAVPAARPLLEAVPALGRALLAAWTLAPDRASLADVLRDHTGRAQTRALLRWLGLPDTGAQLKALQKIADPTRWTLHDLRQLAAWQAAEPKTVQHLPHLTSTHLRLSQMAARAGVRGCLRVGVYRGLTVPPGAAGLESLPDALVQLAQAGRLDRRLLRPIHSPLELAQRIFTALAAHRGATPPAPDPKGPAGVPSPVSVPGWIRPLQSPAALVTEGRRMRHCIGEAGFQDDLVAGRGYGFAVSHPAGRATAWVRPTERPGVVALVDLQGAEDVEPDPAVRSAVLSWIEAHNAWAAHVLHGDALPSGSPVEIPGAAAGFRSDTPACVASLTAALLVLDGDAPHPNGGAAGDLADAVAAAVGSEDLEDVLERNLRYLIEDTLRLREALAEIVHRWRDVEPGTAEQQDAVVLDFTRCCLLLVRTLAAEREALADALDAPDLDDAFDLPPEVG